MSGDGAPSRRWIVCADDFALNGATIDAIVELIERGRLGATGAMTGSPLWRTGAGRLQALAGRADVGLHLNLTQRFEAAAAVWPLPELIWRCWSGALPRAELRGAIRRQLDLFEDALGRAPDFVDGHQHVHQFARVRDELVDALAARYAGPLPWVRDTRPPPSIRGWKARGIGRLGARRLRALTAELGLAANAALVGVYDFDLDRTGYLEHLGRWLAAGPDATVLMCHPGARHEEGDSIASARIVEHEVLGSPEFEEALAAAGVVKATGRRIFGGDPATSADPNNGGSGLPA